MVSSLFAYNPVQRLSPRGVLEHPFLTVGDFPLMGLCSEEAESGGGFEVEGHGRLSFQALLPGVVGQSLLTGERHRWRLRVKEVERELLLYISQDDVFVEGTAANALVVKLASGGEIVKGKTPGRCKITGPKTRIAGHLGVMAGVSMIGLDTRGPCPVARVLDFMKAFRKVNEDWLLVMQDKCKKRVNALGFNRRGLNGNQFLKDSLEKWFLPAAELTLTEAHDASSGYLQESRKRSRKR